MSADTRDKPRILSATPGRIRVHLSHWSGNGQRRLEQHVRAVPGVRRVEANAITGNILIGFDPRTTNEHTLLSVVGSAEQDTAGLPEDKPLPPVMHEGTTGSLRQARIAVRGLDRDPRVARKVLERLRNLFGVRGGFLVGRQRRVDRWSGRRRRQAARQRGQHRQKPQMKQD